MNFKFRLVIAVTILTAISLSCNPKKKDREAFETEDVSKTETTSVNSDPLKEAYFGETHVHTSTSMDAFIGGNRMTPEDAYRFSRGEEVIANGSLHRLKRPLDFCAISDHAV